MTEKDGKRKNDGVMVKNRVSLFHTFPPSFPFLFLSQSKKNEGHNSGKMTEDCEDGVTAVALQQQLPW